MVMRQIALYSISNQVVRARVMSLLKDYGFTPLDGKAMTADVGSNLLLQFISELKKLRLRESETVMIMRLCKDCESRLFGINLKILPTMASVMVY